jgi:hypothetical protein
MKVTMRPARALPKIIVHRKVAAYCRVSTQQEIQHHSLEAQLCCVSTGGQNKEVSGKDLFAFSLKLDEFRFHPHPPKGCVWKRKDSPTG